MQLSSMLNPVSQSSEPQKEKESSAPATVSTHQTASDDLTATFNKNSGRAIQSSAMADWQRDRQTSNDEDLAPNNQEPNLAAAQMDGGRSPKPRIKVETTIKTEPAATPQETTPTSTIEPSLDEATMKAIKEAQNEYSTRRVARKPIIDKLLTPEPEVPNGPPTKKRAAPKASSPTVDDASAGIKKPPPKKRKVELSEDRNTPNLTKRSSTPSSVTGGGRGSKGNTKNARKSSIAGTTSSSSPAHAASPTATSEMASDVEDGGEVYCICRRPDDHTFMIACDGGCEDWFHGKCVDIKKEDQNLIDKYICPNCKAKDVGVTTWKPMCRRDGCRKPARLKKGSESKYCSDECGVAFFKGKVRAAEAALPTTDNHGDEEYLGPLGGPIRTSELKALVSVAPNYETFRRLGSSPLLTPPPSSPEAALKPDPSSVDLNPNASRLSEITNRKAALRARHLLLKDRERLVVMAKERATRLTAAMKAKDPKIKDICGYDSRLSWDDATFSEWRNSDEGMAAFATQTLDPAEGEAAVGEKDDASASTTKLKPRPQPIRTNTSETAPLDGGGPAEVCVRKRCQRHNGWQKLTLHDVRFEEADVGAEMRRVGDEERELRAKGAGSTSMGKDGEGEEETGWVEVVGGDGDGKGRGAGGEEGVELGKETRASVEGGVEVKKEGETVLGGVDG